MDNAFLRDILDDPKQQPSRLVYADWLEEQGTPDARAKAEFVRLSVVLATEDLSTRQRKKRSKRLQELAATLETEWLAVVSSLSIENCPLARGTFSYVDAQQLFYFQCSRTWDELQPTEQVSKRHCNECKKDVHYCDTIAEARNHTRQGHCVAVDLGVIRREGDLEPPGLVMGRISSDAFGGFVDEEEQD